MCTTTASSSCSSRRRTGRARSPLRRPRPGRQAAEDPLPRGEVPRRLQDGGGHLMEARPRREARQQVQEGDATKKGLEEGTTCDPKKARIEPSMETPRECCAKCTGEPECIAWQMKRHRRPLREGEVRPFTDLWLSPEVTASTSPAGRRASRAGASSTTARSRRSRRRRRRCAPTSLCREHIKTRARTGWPNRRRARSRVGTMACACCAGNEEWCYNAAEWKQASRRTDVVPLQGRAVRTDKVTLARVVRGVLQGGVGRERRAATRRRNLDLRARLARRFRQRTTP